MEPSLKITITLGPRGTHTEIHTASEGIGMNDVRQWMERAIIALGSERDALAACKLHGELTMAGFDERALADDVEFASALNVMRGTAWGWRKKALDAAFRSAVSDQGARQIIREAASHLAGRAALKDQAND